ncbi:DUF2784 domain-containing protein [Ilyomonas limi]|uniref:DUF2784 domain-containing protein n=1 Tax=Ilyomonas limi TaxID=2575867 RepID=A0A4U3LAC1_9BACT|nr:DUF2784 domain-containing protein [Ilyomonas limi]TKK71609.1 DUF2784 domain-containing protein [Ilyomonas limi]
MVLKSLDVLFTTVHLAIILFNLFGWIPKATRRAHFMVILLTAASWFLLGIWFGIGYCPVTDWQWQVKTRLGERNLPNSFIKYYAEKLSGRNFDSGFIDAVIATAFGLTTLLSMYVNFMLPRIKRRKRV